MAKKAKIQPEGWRTTRKERLNYYIGDLGRSLEGYIVTAMMTLFLLLTPRLSGPSWVISGQPAPVRPPF